VTELEKKIPRIAQAMAEQSMQRGVAQGKPGNKFLKEAPFIHLDKAIRHICTARLNMQGVSKDTETVDEHLARALTRIAIAAEMLQRIHAK